MSFRQTAATWLVAQCEPLVPTLDRAIIEEALVAETAKNPDRITWWFAGVIADHMLTLPPADPWRHLSARAGMSLSRGTIPKPPPVTGALGRRGVFGTAQDGHDLTRPSFADGSTDVGLAAITSGLSRGGGALLAFATDGWQATAVAARALHVEHLAQSGDKDAAAGRFFGDASGALRWAAWRRRAYLGQGDDWTIVSGFAWLWRAEELHTHGELPEGEWAEVRRAVDAEQVDPDSYTMIADQQA